MLTRQPLDNAGNLLPLRLHCLDAIHLAAAQGACDTLHVVITHDARMLSAAADLGILTASPPLGFISRSRRSVTQLLGPIGFMNPDPPASTSPRHGHNQQNRAIRGQVKRAPRCRSVRPPPRWQVTHPVNKRGNFGLGRPCGGANSSLILTSLSATSVAWLPRP